MKRLAFRGVRGKGEARNCGPERAERGDWNRGEWPELFAVREPEKRPRKHIVSIFYRVRVDAVPFRWRGMTPEMLNG